jgi:transcriptional regulator with XRE-family HTH domain
MPKSVKENLSQFVKRVISEKNLTLREVEQKSGKQIARSYVSRIMTGDVQNITLEKLIALARGLDVDPHSLFTAYYGRPQSSIDESQEVFEWSAVEFVEMMREIVGNPKLTEIVKAATQLWPEEYSTVYIYLSELNERKRKSKGKKLPNGKATT